MNKIYSEYNIKKYFDNYAKEVPDKKIQILNAAISVFSKRGFRASKTKEIAKQAGVAEGTIFRYFKNKDALLEHLVPLTIKISLPKLKKPIEEIIEKSINHSVEDTLFDLIYDRVMVIKVNLPLFKAVIPEIIYRKEILDHFKMQILPVIKKKLSDFLNQAYKKGEIKQVNEDIMLNQIIGFVLFYSLNSLEKEDNKIQEDIKAFVNLLLEGWR